MWELFYLEVIRGKQSWWAGLLRFFFRICSWFYGIAVAIRNYAFNSGLRASRELDATVISVGNLSVGGTGKTPFVAFIVQELIGRGFKPGIVSRGYKASDTSTTNDEYKLLSYLCPETPHAQNRDRFAAARTLIHQYQCNIIVMDDGFQHRQLKRQFDIVLLDASQPAIVNRLLPLGLLREPFSSLERADFVFITRPGANLEQTAQLKKTVLQYIKNEQLGEIDFKAESIIDHNQQKYSLDHINYQQTALFCGIGNPESFFQLAKSLGWNADRNRMKIFPDHHNYTNADHAALEEWANQQGVQTLLTTEKDLVKFPAVEGSTVKIFALRVVTQIQQGELEFLASLENATQL